MPGTAIAPYIITGSFALGAAAVGFGGSLLVSLFSRKGAKEQADDEFKRQQRKEKDRLKIERAHNRAREDQDRVMDFIYKLDEFHNDLIDLTKVEPAMWSKLPSDVEAHRARTAVEILGPEELVHQVQEVFIRNIQLRNYLYEAKALEPNSKIIAQSNQIDEVVLECIGERVTLGDMTKAYFSGAVTPSAP